MLNEKSSAGGRLKKSGASSPARREGYAPSAHGLEEGQVIKVRSSPKKSGTVESAKKVSVFDFQDYRQFLQKYFELKKLTHPMYSQSAFVRRAGLGENSRGYLKLVIEGKRNLTPHTIQGFSMALNLGASESIYFENLVYFNQAKSDQEKNYYFQRVIASAGVNKNGQHELLESQYNFYSNWYYPVVWQVVGLANFREDKAWIAEQLRGKITRKEAGQALLELEKLGLLRRNPQGILEQSEAIVKFSGDAFLFSAQKFQLEMMERARETIIEDPYDQRSASSVTLTCNSKKVSEIRKKIAAFREELCQAFCSDQDADAVFSVNLQLFQLTPLKKGKALTSEDMKGKK